MSTHNIPFSIYKRKSPKIILNLQLWNFFSKGLKNEFETAVINESSVFEPLKFYCTFDIRHSKSIQEETQKKRLRTVNVFNNSGISLTGFPQLRPLKQLDTVSGRDLFVSTSLLNAVQLTKGITNLNNSGARAYCACSRCGWGLFGHSFSRISFSFFFLPLSGKRPDVD